MSDRSLAYQDLMKPHRFRHKYGPRSPVLWAAIVLAIGGSTTLIAGVSDPKTIVLVLIAYSGMGLVGWFGNYRELREGGIKVSSYHYSRTIPYDSIISATPSGKCEVELVCDEDGAQQTQSVDVNQRDRDAFLAELAARIERTLGDESRLPSRMRVAPTRPSGYTA